MKSYISSDKIFSHLDRLQDYLEGGLVKPITVEIHPTNACNNRCYYCIADRYRGRETLSKEELFTIVDRLWCMGTKGVIFSGGGEPLVNKNTILAIDRVRARDMRAGLITNGFALSNKNIPAIVGLTDWVRVSVDSVDRKTYKKIRGVDGADKVVNGIFGLVAERKKENLSCTIGTQAVVTPYNLNDLYGTARTVKELGVDYFQIRPLEGDFTYTREQLATAYRSIEECKGLEDKHFKIIDTDYKWAEVDPDRLARKDYKTCHILPFNGAVDARGDIYLCCHLVGYKQFCYGNLLRDSTWEIFNKRDKLIKKFKIDLKYCPVACRGSLVNQTIEDNYFKPKPHKEFL